MRVSRQWAVGAVAVSLLAGASGATAQEHKVEISGNAGYVLSDGVTFNGVLVNGNIYDSVPTPRTRSDSTSRSASS